MLHITGVITGVRNRCEPQVFWRNNIAYIAGQEAQSNRNLMSFNYIHKNTSCRENLSPKRLYQLLRTVIKYNKIILLRLF
jgi:hypothetical protein